MSAEEDLAALMPLAWVEPGRSAVQVWSQFL
jgi:hypothetical protein